MAATPFDHPLLSGLLGDAEIAPQFSADAELEEFRYFEAALAHAEAVEGVIPADAAEAIAIACAAFEPDVGGDPRGDGAGWRHRAGIRPPAARIHRPKATREYLHFGATSQDLIDTGLVRRLAPILTVFANRLEATILAFDDLDRRFGTAPLMGRTRMQDALPITVADRLAAWRDPLPRHLMRLAELRPRLLVLQFGGAVGTLDKLGDRGFAVTRRLADALDLGLPSRPWHSARDNVAELAGWLSLVSGSLGKLGLDFGLMAQQGEVAFAGGGASSAMPHKSNPVGAEVLVALARHNAGMLSGMHEALLHEQERSGAAWTLEWLTLPQMVMTTGAALRTASALLAGITRLGGTA